MVSFGFTEGVFSAIAFTLRFLHQCSMLVRLSQEHLTRHLCKMAKPPVIKDAAVLKHDALSSYETAAALLQHKVDFPPDNDSMPKDIDDWISDAYLQWIVCSNFWRPTSIKNTAWNDAKYALLACLPLVDMSRIDDSCERFNALVHQVVY